MQRSAMGFAVLAAACSWPRKLASRKLMVLHTAASRVGAMDVGAVTEGGHGSAQPRVPR